jgi:hypothetical protein
MRTNPFKYAASSEQWWKNNLLAMSGYEPKTTFFSDLSIAECFGHNAIQETYDRVLKSYKKDIIYITEFVMCLNHKIWQLHQFDEPTARLYDKLWKNGVDFVYKNFKGKDLSYYFEITD